MELRPRIQLPQQHACSQGGPGHESGLYGLPADRSNTVQAAERGSSRTPDGNRRPLWPVKLKVFDISKGMAELYGGFFVSDKKKGIWHTNVVVFGLEYFYVSTICACPVGMGWPGEEQLKEVLDMGTTERTVFELEAFLRAQQRLFTPNKYDMFKHNCNHFSDLVLRFLNHRLRVPSYIASLPERVLQTTLGRLVYPFVNAALDRTKSEICQHADKAELCGEIFFYGGASPLLLPGERSTRALMKRVMEEFKQQQREAVVHRSSIATCRSKSSSRSGQRSKGSAFLGSRSTRQSAAVATAEYSDAVLARRRERTRYLIDEEGSMWSSQQRHGEVQRQRQQRQQQTQRLQWQPEYGMKKRAQSGSASLERGALSRYTIGAARDDVPASTDEALPSAIEEEFITNGEADSHGEEQTDSAVSSTATQGADELSHWEDSHSSSSAWHRPPRRERSYRFAVHSAGDPRSNDTELPEETQSGGQLRWGSSSGSDTKYLCPCKSHADFLRATDDTSNSTAGAGSAVEAQHKPKRPTRRLPGVTSAAWSDCSTSSEASRPRTSLACGTSGERVCRSSGTRVVGPLARTTPIREVELPFCDAGESKENNSSWRTISGSLVHLVDRADQRSPQARPDGSSARGGKFGSTNTEVILRQAPELRGTATGNALSMSVSSSSTTVDSRLSTYSGRSGTSPSNSNAYMRKGSEGHHCIRNSASFVEDPPADDRLNYGPAQSFQIRDHQRMGGVGAQVVGNLGHSASVSPTRRRFVSETNGSTFISARDIWKCGADENGTDVEPLRFSRANTGVRRCTTGWSRNSYTYESCNDVCGSGRLLLSPRQHSRSTPTSIGAGENRVESDEKQQNRSCGTRHHIITSGILPPIEGDVAAEDVHGSTESSKYSSFSEVHDSCTDPVIEPVQRWPREREEVQHEQNDQTQAHQARKQDYTRNNEKQNRFVTSAERRTSLATGRTCLDSPFPSIHSSSASSGSFEQHPHVGGQDFGLNSITTRVPTVCSSSCSCLESVDVEGREARVAAGPVGQSSSAEEDEVDFSDLQSKVPVYRSALADPAAADESEPVWQDAEEEAERQGSRGGDCDQSENMNAWFSAVPARPAGVKAEAGETSERRDGYLSHLSPSDYDGALNLSASTAPPFSKHSSFESASDCCFLESAHEDDLEEEEEGQTFQEAGSDETARNSFNQQERGAGSGRWRDWWHQQEQQQERNAGGSPTLVPEVQPKKDVSQRLLYDRYKQTENFQDDLEPFRTSFLPTSSPAPSPRCRSDNVGR